jgi:uncharacterized membrane protein
VRYQASPCEFHAGQSDIGAGLPPKYFGFAHSFHQCSVLIIIIIVVIIIIIIIIVYMFLPEIQMGDV